MTANVAERVKGKKSGDAANGAEWLASVYASDCGRVEANGFVPSYQAMPIVAGRFRHCQRVAG